VAIIVRTTLVYVVQPNTEYDPFAVTYNWYWGADYREQCLPVVETLLLSHLKADALILDIGCGTGQFTAAIARQGYKVIGIDPSEQMIRFARKNAPRTELFVADARDFSLEARFDGAYSVFETLNHLPDRAGLQQAFACIHRHLNAGAPFLFDLNTSDAFETYWNETNALVADDHAWISRTEYDEDSRVGKCHMTVFRRAGQWLREDFTIRQFCHDLNAVSADLGQAGFHDLAFYDAADAGMDPERNFGRTFLVAFA
jgi:SAM-dependent methyltransferase